MLMLKINDHSVTRPSMEDKPDMTPTERLMKAIYNGPPSEIQNENIQNALADGADPHEKVTVTVDPEDPEAISVTPAEWVVRYEQNPDTISNTLDSFGQAGVDLNRPDNKNGQSLLHKANGRFNRKQLAVEALLRNGADPNVQDHLGNTPTHEAALQLVRAIGAQRSLNQQMTVLLHAGADPRIPNEDGQTVAGVIEAEVARTNANEQGTASKREAVAQSAASVLADLKKHSQYLVRQDPQADLDHGVTNGRADAIRDAIQRGADIQARRPAGRTGLNGGHFVRKPRLHHVAELGDKESAQALLEAGADPHQEGWGLWKATMADQVASNEAVRGVIEAAQSREAAKQAGHVASQAPDPTQNRRRGSRSRGGAEQDAPSL